MPWISRSSVEGHETTGNRRPTPVTGGTEIATSKRTFASYGKLMLCFSFHHGGSVAKLAIR
jgi:hypothetical protein